MPIHSPAPACQRGVSLIETMVALAIGMLLTLIIYQLYATFEGQKRTTGGSGGAQVNGMVSMLALERDIRMAAWSMNDPALMECAMVYSYASNVTTGAQASNSLFSSLMPVRIRDGGDSAGSSDQIIVRFGTSVAGAAPAIVGTVMNNETAELRVESAAAFNQNDVVVVASGTDCTVGQITNVDPAWGKIERGPSSLANMNPSSSYRRSNWPLEKEGAKIFSLGSFIHRTYEVQQGNLVLSEDGGNSKMLVANHIVGTKAAYGITDGNSSQEVVKWVRATSSASGGVDWSNPDPVNARRIKAVRLSVLARSPLREKQSDSGGDCTATSEPPLAWKEIGQPNALRTFDVSDRADWKCYRYRVYETVIPLRNVLWANV